jgi:hypothetical protein
MLCFWCRTEGGDLTADHALPRALGGTSQFSVNACKACQNRLSKAEDEVARRSVLAIHALSSSLGPRHPERPTSGHLKPVHLLAKHPHGGYGETLFSCGDRLSSLPYFEVNFATDRDIRGRFHGASATDAQRLLDTFRRGLTRQPAADGSLFSLKVDCNLAPEIAEDPEFCPRIVLLPGDRLLLRARSPEEAMRYVNVFMGLVSSDYKVDSAKWGEGTVIKGGTPHSLVLNYNPQTIRRVAAKIAYTLFAILSGHPLERRSDPLMRRYILDLPRQVNGFGPVSAAPEPATSTTSDEPHFVVLSPAHDRAAAVVCLYGFKFRVDLGEGSQLPNPIVVLCEIDGSSMRIAGIEEAEEILSNAAATPFLQVATLAASRAMSDTHVDRGPQTGQDLG